MNKGPKPRAVMERLLEKVEIVPWSGCWIWTGATNDRGYGVINENGRQTYTHIVSYRSVHGEIPVGLVVDHLCRVRCCCNPSHLEMVSQSENLARGVHPNFITKTTAVCKRGHPMKGKNRMVNTDGGVRCRACYRLRKVFG